MSERKKIVIIGGGPIRIGQGIEFDYCCVHAAMALKQEGVEAIIINNNPETVSTDYDASDKLYFEPLTFEDVTNVLEKEKPWGVIVQFGGQTPLNLAIPLSRAGANILGTRPENINMAEDRELFNRLLRKLGIPQPEGATAFSTRGAAEIAASIGYPVLVRPSYVLGGRSMTVVTSESDLALYMSDAVEVSGQRPVLIDRFLQEAIEVDVDAICDGKDVFIAGILEHIEMAGVHSGDAAMVMPTQSLNNNTLSTIRRYTKLLARELHVVGLMNIQYAVKEDKVYVLEVNPRASRTVPLISKAIGIPLAKVATKVLIGRTLRELNLLSEINIGYVVVKESVFPFSKFPELDPIIGPEMKSTGEVMGIDRDFGKAFYKSQISAGNRLPTNGTILISMSSRDRGKELQEIGIKLSSLGFTLLATDGTARALADAGVKSKVLGKIGEPSPNVGEYLDQGFLSMIINTPTVGREPLRDGYRMRQAAIQLRIPYITTLMAAKAATNAIESLKVGKIASASLDHWHREKMRHSCV